MRLDHSSKAQIKHNFSQCVSNLKAHVILKPNGKTSLNKVTGATAPMFQNSIYIISSNNKTLSYST